MLGRLVYILTKKKELLGCYTCTRTKTRLK
jgi:hypothetical protein